MRKFFATASFAVLILATSSIAAADTTLPDEQWSEVHNSSLGFQGIIINDALDRGQKVDMFSLMQGHRDNPVADYVCSSTSAAPCSGATSFRYFDLLPPCATDSSMDCIVGISAYKDGKLLGDGKYQETIYPDHLDIFQGDPSLKIPTPSEPSIWDIPSAPHSRGTSYLLAIGLDGSTNRINPTGPTALYANIYAVEKTTQSVQINPVANAGKYGRACIQQSRDASGNKTLGIVDSATPYVQCVGAVSTVSAPGNPACLAVFNSQGNCLLRDPMDTDVNLQINLRVSTPINGWLHGRMSNPEITLNSLPSGGQSVSISAAPIKVPIFFAGDIYTNLPLSLQTAYANLGGLSMAGWGTANADHSSGPIAQRNARSEPFNYGTDSINELKLWLDYAKNKSVAAPTTWSLRTLDQQEMQTASPCFKNSDGLKGIVATNSTTYSDGPPAFTDGSLTYQVASPHFQPDGVTPFKGTYNLIMRSDIARCLYGFSKAPVQATINVISESGEDSIATTVVGEKNNWLSLAAYNFEFSAPTIQVKLTQEAPAPVPAPKVAAKKITCIKGKVSKVISSTSCPAGYKKR
jgi:hypothetical protein